MQLSSSSSRLRPPAAHAGVPGLGGSSSIGQSIRLHHLHQQRLGPILHPHHQHPAPSSVVCSAKKGKGSGDKGDEKADAKKADFSAYWSLKVRQWFSARKDYLEGSEEQRGKRPEILKKLDEAIVEKQQEMDRLNDAERQVRMAQAARDVQADKLAGDDARKMLAPLEKALFKDGLPDMQSQLSPEQQANMDMQNARAYLHTTPVQGVALALYRVRTVLQALLMLPFTLMAALWKGWHGLFKSQSYEHFLMSEGERIWFWRNRMENERWFWEIFAWDRLVFPILCTVAYQYIVPNHLVWVLVVPFMFIMWQTGEFPGPFTMEFWLIMYFGVYKKCWGDVTTIARMLFQWA